VRLNIVNTNTSAAVIKTIAAVAVRVARPDTTIAVGMPLSHALSFHRGRLQLRRSEADAGRPSAQRHGVPHGRSGLEAQQGGRRNPGGPDV